MPGPRSKPWARTESGRLVGGKTALRQAGLRSGQGMKDDSYQALPDLRAKARTPKHDRSKEDS